MSDYDIPQATLVLFEALQEALRQVHDPAAVEPTVRRVLAAYPEASWYDVEEVLVVVRLELWPGILRERAK